MKKFSIRRFTAGLLACVLLFNSFQLDSKASEVEETNDEEIAEAQEEDAEDSSDIMCEIVEERSEYSKEYELEDFSHVAVLYAEPVHYENENGEMEEIDNSIIETEEGYTNADNSYDVVFSGENSEEATVSFLEDDYEISWTVKDENAQNLDAVVTAETDETSEDGYYVVPESSITYSGFSDNFEIEYLPQSLGVKENIILEDSSCESFYTFALNIKGLSLSINEDGEAEFRDSNTNELKYYFPAPYMEDANGNVSTNVKYVIGKYVPVKASQVDEKQEENQSKDVNKATEDEQTIDENIEAEQEATELIEDENLKDSDEGDEEFEIELDENASTDEISDEAYDEVTEEISIEATNGAEDEISEDNESESDITVDDTIYLSIVADDEWLASAAYPVVIDPEIKKANSNGVIDSGCFDSFGRVMEKLLIGVKSEVNTNSDSKAKVNNIYNSYLKFELPSIPKQSIISNAKLYLNNKETTNTNNSITVSKILEDCYLKNQADGGKLISFENKPTVGEVLDYSYDTGYFDITKAIRDWYEHPENNNGLLFKPYDEKKISCSSITLRKGKTAPYLLITYRTAIGLEDYYSTHSVDAGTAGSASINDYTGSLTITNTDIATTGERAPMTISHVYNSNASGKKWSLNYEERISVPSGIVDTTTYPYIYTDEDGTPHYFKKQSVTYLCNGAATTVDASAAIPPAKDEDGLKLFIVPVTDKNLKNLYSVKLIDKSASTVKYFDKLGRLAKIVDSNVYEKDIYKNISVVDTSSKDRALNAISITFEDDPENNVKYTEDLSRLHEVAKVSAELVANRNKITDKVALKEQIDNLMELYSEVMSGYFGTYNYAIGMNASKAYETVMYVTDATAIADMRTAIVNANNFFVKAENEAKTFDGTSEKRIASISDGIGRTSTFTYNESGLLSSISDPTSATASSNKYEYNWAGNLTKITFSNGAVANYAYDKDNNLQVMQDNTGYSVNYSYVSGSSKVEKVVENSTTATGQTYSIIYGTDNTNTFRFSGLNDTYGDSDDIENVYVFDEKGHAICTYSKFTGQDDIIGAQASAYGSSEDDTKNKIKNYAVVGMTTQNLLKNHSFEYGSNEWTKYESWSETVSAKILSESATAFIGSKDAHFAFATASTGTMGYKQTTGRLSAGTYTLSAYVKAASLKNSKFYLKAKDEAGNVFTSDSIDVDTSTSFDKGWERCTLTLTLSSTQSVEVFLEAECSGADKYAGTIDVDCVQLESGNKANDYNILEDGNFELTDDMTKQGFKWTPASGVTGTSLVEGGVFGNKCLHITGEPGKNKTVSQTVHLKNSNQGYVLSGWIKAECTPSRDSRLLRVTAYHKTEEVEISTYLDINNFSSGWRYFSLIIPIKNWGSTSIRLTCNKNIGDVYIDNLQLSANDISSKKYDSSGRVISSCASEKTNSYSYDSYNRLTGLTIPNGATSTMKYNGYNDVTSVNASIGPNVHFQYDAYGNKTSTRTNAEPYIDENGNVIKRPGLYSTSAYDDTHSYLTSVTDARGNSVGYTYNTVNGNLETKTVPNTKEGTTEYSYTYDSYKNLTSTTQTSDNQSRSIKYEYNGTSKDLTQIVAPGCTYGYTYDSFGNLLSTTVAGKTVSENIYNQNNGSLIKTKYSDGTSQYNDYDVYGRTVSNKTEEKDGTVHETDRYEYYNDGGMAEHTDVVNNRADSYEYNDSGKIIRTKVTAADNKKDVESRMQYSYNVAGQVGELSYQEANESVKKYLYAYAADGEATKNTLPDGSIIARAYDSLRRNYLSTYAPLKTAADNKKLYTKVSYMAGASDKLASNVTASTNLVSKFTQQFGSNGKVKIGYEYLYNNRDQITEIKDTVKSEAVDTKHPDKAVKETKEEYSYNNFGELTEAKSIVDSETVSDNKYTYDNSGNILTETVEKAGKTVTHTYVYDTDSDWKDLLISYDDQAITYDDAGKPTEYLGKTLTWSAINDCLTSVEQGSNRIDYTYLSNGSRYTKTIAGKTKTYFYNNGIMLSERTDTERLNYYYDSDGAVVELGVQKKASEDVAWGAETRYFLVRNGKSDIVAIYKNADSSLVGTYEYDAWGNVLSVKVADGVTDSDDIMNLNPIRYRSYYYDTETKFYYLNARYYDPETHRFISADSEIAGVSDGVTGYNLFAYCDNDPINKCDASGNFPEWSEIATSSNCKKVAIGLAVITAVAVVAVATGGTGAPAAVAAIHCFCAGAAPAAVSGAVGGAVQGGIQSAAITALTGGSKDDVITSFASGAADGFMWGAITGAVTGGMTSNHCFVAGTLIDTPDGKVPIEQIQAGDYVLSTDKTTGDTTYKQVLETYVRDEYTLVHLVVDGEVITTTEEHPFFVSDKGWVIAKELAINDRLVASDGSTKTVELISEEQLETPVKVYNFAVEDYHTYYVGSGVLVHNKCGSELRNTQDQNAVLELAKEAKKNGGVDAEDAKTIMEWAKEYDVPFHGPERHLNRPQLSSQNWHFHVGKSSKTGHIPIRM